MFVSKNSVLFKRTVFFCAKPTISLNFLQFTSTPREACTSVQSKLTLFCAHLQNCKNVCSLAPTHGRFSVACTIRAILNSELHRLVYSCMYALHSFVLLCVLTVLIQWK